MLIPLFLLLGAVYFSATFVLPAYIENSILPDFSRRLATSLSARVYGIGVSAADIGDIAIGDPQNPAVKIGSVHADYAIPPLLRGKINRLKINGLELFLEIAHGSIISPGLYPDINISPETKAEPEQALSEISLPIEPESLEISNGIVRINYEGKLLLLAFDLQLLKKSVQAIKPLYDFRLHLLPQGEIVSLTGTIDLGNNTCTVNLAADSLDVSKFIFLLPAFENKLPLKTLSIKGNTKISLRPFQVESANLQIDPGRLSLGNTSVRFGQDMANPGPAIRFDINKEMEQWLVNVESHISEPIAASLGLHGSMVQSAKSLDGSGNIVIVLADSRQPEKELQLIKSLQNFPELLADFTFATNESGLWRVDIMSPDRMLQDPQKIGPVILHDTLTVQSMIPWFKIHGQWDRESLEGEASVNIEGIKAQHKSTAISVPEASLHARLVSQLLNGKETLRAEGRMTLSNSEIIDDANAVHLKGVNIDLPWSWPQSTSELTGEITAQHLQWQEINLGSFSSVVGLQDMAYSLDGEFTSSLLKGFAAKVSGRAGFKDNSMEGELTLQSDSTPFAALDLGRFDPALKKSYFRGELGMNGSLSFDTRGVNGMLQIMLQNGHYEFPEKSYQIKGIDLSIHIPALPNIRTDPAQTLYFSEAAMGSFAFSKGKITWQLESADTIFLEDAVVQWAGGRVFTSSIRVSPKAQEMLIPIFCDRLRLTELLKQFGFANAQGEGTVNGRIPLHIGKGAIRFEDGFLYSSPGQSGSIKVSAFDMLSAGIPKNTPQFAQIDFAAEALKNFQYNWVKLLLNTEGEDLVMQMQMDGKPVKSLPFSYDSQTGMLQRLEQHGQGIDQPIRLDVNFRFPLNRFLGYSGKIQDLMKKIK